MDPNLHLNLPKSENPNEFDWLNENPFEQLPDLPPVEYLLDFSGSNPQFESFDDFFNCFPEPVLNNSRTIAAETEHGNCSSKSVLETESVDSNERFEEIPAMNRKREQSSCEIGIDEIRKYFEMPITRAAKEMKIGLTVLKKRCRELNIMRWPYRKIKSLKALIDHHKEEGICEEIGMLEEHKRLIEHLPDVELTHRTKKLRQASFKSNYKKRRLLGPSSL